MNILAKAALLGLTFTLTAAATSCNSGDPLGPTFVTDLVLKSSAGLPRTAFAQGEPITLELTVRNRTDTEVVIQFEGGQQFEFVVLDAGTSRVRWKWSSDKAFVQWLSELTFAPGQTHTFTATWDQRGDDKQLVGPGSYEARGVLLFQEFATNPLAQHQLGSPLKAFRID